MSPRRVARIAVPGIAFGGDYNPEQWPRATWAEDVRLMAAARVGLVSVGIFSWALLEPASGRFDFEWLDEALDTLHEGGVRVDLATATASPPPWLTRQHPEILPVRADGVRLWPGGRQAWCPSSPVFREHSLRLVRELAQRYGNHPAVVLWHVSNELGGHNARCYCDVSADAFRQWLRGRYETLDDLNAAWGTAFWSQHYGDWDEILPPRIAPTFPNPTQQLDFHRFSSDAVRDQLRAERDVLTALTPEIPVTTNFMAMKFVRDMDYWSWVDDVDVVSNDHYLDSADPDNHVELAFSADLTRGLAGGRPWWLMEHSTSAVNWQQRNVAKTPGQLRRNSLGHVARGSDAVLFFQWRQSRAGAEKFHSALLPHAGTDTKVWREVCALGADLQRIGEVAGSVVRHDVAMVFDWQSWWGAELDSHPTNDLSYLDRSHAHYRALWDQGVGVDFVPPDGDLSGYSLLIVSTLYLTGNETAARIKKFVHDGGTLLVTYWSGIVDEHDHVWLGGYPGAFREVLGVHGEEFFPLRDGERVMLDDGASADQWTELLHLDGATAVSSYADGALAGVPAVTRNDFGSGTAWYVATRLDQASVARLLTRIVAEAGVEAVADTVAGVEVVRRRSDAATYLFVLNHTQEPATIPAHGVDLLTGEAVSGKLDIAAGDVAVIREQGR
jgi:beta-galactosidase